MFIIVGILIFKGAVKKQPKKERLQVTEKGMLAVVFVV